MKKLTSTLMFTLVLFGVAAQNCNCKNELKTLIAKVEADYAGFHDKVYHGDLMAYDAHTADMLLASESINTFYRCFLLQEKFLTFFNDKHLTLNLTRNIYFAFERVDEDAVMLRIPSFAWERKEMIEDLIDNNMEEITSSAILIIDLRGNGGGSDYCFEKLLPFIYTQPYVAKGVEWWASEGNIEYFETALKNGEIKEGMEEETRVLTDSLRKYHNQFVMIDKEDTIMMNKSYDVPYKVGVIVDDFCGSSCEQFVLAAKQSEKTTVFGTNTLGVLDYSNVVSEELTIPGLSLQYPMTRSSRLPSTKIDNVGIAPDVEIELPVNLNLRSEVDEWVRFTYDYLKSDEGKAFVE